MGTILGALLHACMMCFSLSPVCALLAPECLSPALLLTRARSHRRQMYDTQDIRCTCKLTYITPYLRNHRSQSFC